METTWTKGVRDGVLVLAMVIGAAPAAGSDIAGTAWTLSGSVDYGKNRKVDHRVSLRAKGSRALAGSSCCSYFVVSFPTADTFSLRADGYEIARGRARVRGSRVRLLPDASWASTLAQWLEDDTEDHWNAGVFDLRLRLEVTAITRQSLILDVQTAGGGLRGVLRLSFAYRATTLAVQNVRAGRFAPGPGRGRTTFVVRTVDVGSVSNEEEPYLYPLDECSAGDRTAGPSPRAWPDSGGDDPECPPNDEEY